MKAPPQNLVDEIYRITEGVGLHKVLGLYHIEKEEDSPAIKMDRGPQESDQAVDRR